MNYQYKTITTTHPSEAPGEPIPALSDQIAAQLKRMAEKGYEFVQAVLVQNEPLQYLLIFRTTEGEE